MPTPVAVNVYDLHEYNDYAFLLGVGIFHSGLEVHGREYAFGGHDHASSGIFETSPREAPAPARFRSSVIVGYTDLTPDEVGNLVAELDQSFHGNQYHLLERNCNVFVEALCFELTGAAPPAWVNRLARVAVAANQCAPCILPASVRAVASIPSAPPTTQNGNGNALEMRDALESEDDDAPLLRQPRRAAMSKLSNRNGR
jgi:hypothetical protein